MPLGLGLMMGLGHNVAASGGGAVATTWSGVTSSSDWVLSNGNLTATRPAGSGDKMVLGSAFKTAGSFTVTITATGSGNRIIGVANASVSNATYVGDANSLGYIAKQRGHPLRQQRTHERCHFGRWGRDYDRSQW
jgi:hypothetical protein